MKSLDVIDRPLYQLFTVVIDLDHELKITGVSSLISRNAPEVRIGKALSECFEMIRPRSLTPDNVDVKLKNLVLLIGRDSRYPIRGQMLSSSKKIGGYVLVGSPWLSHMVEENNQNYRLSDFPLHDAQVEWLFMLGAEKQQVKELKRLSAELEDAKNTAENAIESKSRFFAVMSHEIRTPLNGIIGAIQLMPTDMLDEESRNLLDVCSGAANQLLAVLNDVLDFSKIEAGKMSIEMTRFQPDHLFEAVLSIVSPNIGEKHVQLSYTVAEDVPGILEGDDGKIKQVLLNLVANALRFTESGSITITAKVVQARESDLLLRIEVCDTGAGISEENQRRLFDQFWTSSGDSRVQSRGTGLGLDIAKRLTELIGGEIGVESELGRGSVFWIEIPVRAARVKQESGQTGEPVVDGVKQVLARKRILVAEDNQANQLIARLSLEKLGMIVDIAGNGLEAVDAVKNRPYDIVFMDLGMPEMSGYEAAAVIRGELGRTDLPIIACSAHSKASSNTDDTSNFDGYLAKPVTRENMINILLQWVGPQNAGESAPKPRNSIGPAPQQDIIDRAILDQLSEDLGKEYLGEALNALKVEIGVRMTKINNARYQLAYDTVMREAHALKSGALSFGARQLSQKLDDIEILAEQGSDRVWPGLEVLATVCQATLEELNKLS